MPTGTNEGGIRLEPRSVEERARDTQRKLRTEVDCWVASADEAGNAYLVPLSFLWDGARLVLATPGKSITARNLKRAGRVRVGIGPTRDVVMVEGTLEFVAAKNLEAALAEAYAAHAGWDPRAGGDRNVYMLLTPVSIQAWREANELAGRDVMREGEWLTGKTGAGIREARDSRV